MAIDPRISLAARAPNVSDAINIFENAMMNSQTRSTRQAQEQRTAELQPFQLQQAQQGVDINKQTLDANQVAAQQNSDQRILKSINDFAIGNQSIINQTVNTGDPAPLLQALTTRREKLVQQGLPIDETNDAIADLQRGDIQSVVSGLSDGVALYNQGQGGSQQANSQFGSQKTFKDSKGNLFLGTMKMNPNDGTVQSVLSSVDGSTKQPEGSISLVSGLGQTSKEKSDTKVDETQQIEDIKVAAKGKGAAVVAGVAQGVKAFEKIPLVRTAIGNYNDAIAAIDAGAETGTFDRLMPSFNQASKTLDNTIKRLGLDVVGNTTFGALSESELAFALSAAAPDNMQPAELKNWFIAKRNAQEKILSGLDEVSTYLTGGDKTIKDWKQKQVIDRLANPASQQQIKPEATATPVSSRYTIEVIN
jgi:hypothetical protein